MTRKRCVDFLKINNLGVCFSVCVCLHELMCPRSKQVLREVRGINLQELELQAAV